MDELIATILKAWGPPGAILIAQTVYFLKKEKQMLEAIDKRDASRKVEQDDWEKRRDEFTQKYIAIIQDTTQILTTISNHIEEIQKTTEKLNNLVEQLRYLRLFLEKVMRVREPGGTEKFSAPEEMR